MRLFVLLAVATVGAAAHLVGHSVEGRRIVAYELGDPTAARKVLVVGCMHGNECAGIAVVDRLQRLGPLDGVDLWLVPDANPDGRAAGTRRQRSRSRPEPQLPAPLATPGGAYYSGPKPASEPETRALMRLIGRLRPTVTIWFHQHLNMVVLTRGNLGLQRRFARLAGLRAGSSRPTRARRLAGRTRRCRARRRSRSSCRPARLPPQAVARLALAVRRVAVPY